MKKLATSRLRVKIFEQIMGFARVLQKIPEKTIPPPFRLMQIGSQFWQSRALYVATKLGVADVLGDAEKDTKQIAAELHLHEDHLYRLLRMLTTIGIFEETSPHVFRNSRTSEFLRTDNSKNVRAIILMHNSPEMTQPWMEPLENSIQNGSVPFAREHGLDLFSYMDQNKDFDLLFSQAMDAVENLTGDAFLQDFNWGTFERIIDVGGSRGSKSIAILKLFPDLYAVVFDRPQIVEGANAYWTGKVADELQARITFQPGNIFETLPVARSSHDLYMFFAIFHGLSDDESELVLGNLKTAIGTSGAHALIVDAIAEDIDINPTVAAFDMQMLIGTKGRERTLIEWQHLLGSAGFEITEVVDVRTFAKFIVAKTSDRTS